jgi:hypothetical protein
VVLDGADGPIDGDVVWAKLSVLAAVALLSSSVVVLASPLASEFRETPKRLSISGEVRPLDSRKAILRSVDASRIDSSCKNLDACSRSVDRAVSLSTSLSLSSEAGGAAEVCCCHSGIDGLESESDMVTIMLSEKVDEQRRIKSEKRGVEKRFGVRSDAGW